MRTRTTPLSLRTNARVTHPVPPCGVSPQAISTAYLEKGDFVGVAGEAMGELYGYGFHDVLFKPTKATNHPFRATPASAMSYFVGADNLPGSEEYKGEDAGFAINGGNGWKKVLLNNHKIDLNGDTALATGLYDFTCATTGNVLTVEYTFGYRRCSDGKLRICLHHSSVPYAAMLKAIPAKELHNNDPAIVRPRDHGRLSQCSLPL